MVLTREELVSSLQNEVRILLHLAGKVDRAQLDYRPSPGQRSTLELLQYLTVMGPGLVAFIRAGVFDMARWQSLLSDASRLDFDESLAAIGNLIKRYPQIIAEFSDDDLRSEVQMFHRTGSRGSILVNIVLGHQHSLPHAVVPLPQGMRARGAGHGKSLGWRGRRRRGVIGRPSSA